MTKSRTPSEPAHESSTSGNPDSAPADEGSPADELSLEDRLRRLDEIVNQLEGGEVELETGLELFEEGVRHVRRAEALLSQAELRVEELVGEVDSARTRPLDTPGHGDGEGGGS